MVWNKIAETNAYNAIQGYCFKNKNKTLFDNKNNFLLTNFKLEFCKIGHLQINFNEKSEIVKKFYLFVFVFFVISCHQVCWRVKTKWK